VWQVPLAASVKTDNPLIKTKDASFKIIGGTDYPLVLNHDGQSYFVAHYENQPHFESILDAVSTGQLGPIDRLLLVQNYLLLERAGQVSTLQNIRLLPAFADETDETVWGMLAGIIGGARTLIDADDELEEKLNAFIRPLAARLVERVGWQGQKNESAQTQKLRSLALSLAASAGDQAVIDQGLESFKSFKLPSDLAPDVRQTVYYTAVRYGTDADFERLGQLYKSVGPDEQEEIAAELTSTRDSQKTEQLLKMIKTDVRPQDFMHWFAWLIRNRYSKQRTWTWLTHNWDWIEDKFGSDKSYDYIPRYAASAFTRREDLKNFKEFFEPKQNIALERAIKLGEEEIEGRIAWRDDNEQPVKDWLAGL
jgi:aminopeptidase N